MSQTETKQNKNIKNMEWGSTVGAVAGAGLGMLSSSLGIGNKQQRKQQKLLNEDAMGINYKYSSMAANKAYQQQKEMYERSYKDESPLAKRKQLEEAGLSVGLMYGGSGGMGGAGTASTAPMAQVGSAQPGNATKDGGNTIQGAMMGINLARQQAEIANIEADTILKNKEAGVKEVTKPNIEANTKLLLEQIPNEKLRGEAIEWSNKQQEIQTEILKATEINQIEQIQANARIANHQAKSIILQVQHSKLDLQTKKSIQNAIISDAYLSLDYKQSQIYKNLAETEKTEVETILAPLQTIINNGNMEINAENAETRKNELIEIIKNNKAKIKQGYINKGVEEIIKLYLGMGKNTVDLIDAIIPF